MRKAASWATAGCSGRVRRRKRGPRKRDRNEAVRGHQRAPGEERLLGEAGQPDERGRHVQRPDERAGGAREEVPRPAQEERDVQDVVVEAPAVVDPLEVGPEALAVRRGQGEDRPPVEPGPGEAVREAADLPVHLRHGAPVEGAHVGDVVRVRPQQRVDHLGSRGLREVADPPLPERALVRRPLLLREGVVGRLAQEVAVDLVGVHEKEERLAVVLAGPGERGPEGLRRAVPAGVSEQVGAGRVLEDPKPRSRRGQATSLKAAVR